MRSMNNSILHKKTYDDLAGEYERRVDSSLAVTGDAMDYFSSYVKPGGVILDIGCGVGIAMNVLTKKGFKVAGIEISPKNG